MVAMRGSRWFGVLALSVAAACNADDAPAIDAPPIDAPLIDAVEVDAVEVDAVEIDAVAVDAPPPTCATELPCVAAPNGHLTVCGRLADTETTQTIADDGAGVTPCDPGNPTATGPCSLRITLHDALDYAMNPAGAPVLVPGETYVDACGRFAVRDVPEPAFGFLAIVVDGATDGVSYRPTVVALSSADARPARGFTAYATRRSSEQAWSASAGLSPGFGERGSVLMTFRYHGAPRSGVQVRRNSVLIPDDDFYFSDATAVRTTIATAQTATGANGSALVVDGAPTLMAYDGTGGEPAPCVWPRALAVPIPGVVFVQDREPVTTAGGACP